ncbi:MAG: 8-oxo-dGTP diphosphatase [Planctomycetota bacterium]
MLHGVQIKSESEKVPSAVAVVVTHQARVLFGKRVTGIDKFEWQLPGGWIEPGESLELAARREVHEETGLELGQMCIVAITNNVFSLDRHSISLVFEAECIDNRALTIIEAEKCSAWEWMGWAEITDNLYLPLQQLKNTDYRPISGDKRRMHVSF